NAEAETPSVAARAWTAACSRRSRSTRRATRSAKIGGRPIGAFLVTGTPDTLCCLTKSRGTLRKPLGEPGLREQHLPPDAPGEGQGVRVPIEPVHGERGPRVHLLRGQEAIGAVGRAGRG